MKENPYEDKDRQSRMKSVRLNISLCKPCRCDLCHDYPPPHASHHLSRNLSIPYMKKKEIHLEIFTPNKENHW